PASNLRRRWIRPALLARSSNSAPRRCCRRCAAVRRISIGKLLPPARVLIQPVMEQELSSLYQHNSLKVPPMGSRFAYPPYKDLTLCTSGPQSDGSSGCQPGRRRTSLGQLDQADTENRRVPSHLLEGLLRRNRVEVHHTDRLAPGLLAANVHLGDVDAV